MTVALVDAFSHPPTDGSLALGELVDYNMKNNATRDFAVLVDSSEDGCAPPVHVNYRHLGLAVHRVAHLVNPQGVVPRGTNVGILTSTDTIVNIALVLGVMRAGLVAFPISPRASVAGISHLLVSTNTHHLVAGGSPAISHLVESISITLEQTHSLHIIPVPSFAEVFPELAYVDSEPSHEAYPYAGLGADNTVVSILHSSGSTGLPRAISYTQAGVLTNFINQPPCWQMGGPEVRVGLMALPTFHVMGFMTQCFFPQCAGYTAVLFAPKATPVIPSPHISLQTIVRSQCEFLLTVPAFLEAWSNDEYAVRVLKELRGVVYAGGPLTPWIGDSLVKQGVPLRAAYGSTELGAPVVFDLVKRAPEDWVYVEFPDYTCLKLIPQDDEDGTFELVMLCTPRHVPFMINYHADGQSGYSTKDLVLLHPTKPELIKFVGRVDDQIVLSNGEKTNPVPMESEIIKCPLVRAVVIFGRERTQTGVLIELEDSQLDPALDLNFEDVISKIWSFVERANQGASTHSRIAKEAIIFASTDRPLPRTPKGNVARAASLSLYSEDISSMYSRLAQYSSPSSQGFSSWRDFGSLESWLILCVENLLHRKPDACQDLFQHGLDSLTVTLLLGKIKGAMIASSDDEVRRAAECLTQQAIFAHPTARQLGGYLLGLVERDSNSEGSGFTESSAETSQTTGQSMVERYSETLCACPASRIDALPLECVLLTGTTGALGSHLLALMLGEDKVKRVWALNRLPKSGAPSTIQRQRRSFEERMFDTQLLDHPKLTMLECDFSDGRLGLSDQQYGDMQNAVTTIIHNAWQVDFNLNLQSFEPSIRGTRNLLDLASKHAPRFMFTSSISSLGLGLPGRTCSEEYIKDSAERGEFGYGESKYVAEKILEMARSMGYETCIARIGQLTGDSRSGAWTKTDWVPAMVASSIGVGHLPEAIGMTSWIPLDAAAKTLLEVCSAKHLPPVVHIVHPRPIRWSALMEGFGKVFGLLSGKELSLVPFSNWNRMVVQAASSLDHVSARRRFPSTMMQTIFDTIARSDTLARNRSGIDFEEIQALGVPRLETCICTSQSPTMESIQPLGEEDVASWMRYWSSAGLFEKI